MTHKAGPPGGDDRHKRCRECGRFMPPERWTEPAASQESKEPSYWKPLHFPICNECVDTGNQN